MPACLAIAAHPDDIEFLFAGAMIHLADRGWDLHYVNLCDGSRGSTTMDRKTCARTRLQEAQAAAEYLGATFYGPIFADMEGQYTPGNMRKVAAIVRQAKPTVLLTHSPIDYMEDHEAACRLAVSAAFAHGMPNFESDPPVPAFMDPVTVYHAQPVHNRLPTGELVQPHFFVDTTEIMDRKTASLACHASQREWLDESQGLDSYLETGREVAREVGRMSGGRYEYAEGWRRREHWGFCNADDDPLAEALANVVQRNPASPR